MRELIVRAITERRIIELDYLPGLRRIEPHALGWSRHGDMLLRAYQTEGASASGEHEWWKLFRLDRAGHATLVDQGFDGPRPEYKRGDKHMAGGIICEL